MGRKREKSLDSKKDLEELDTAAEGTRSGGAKTNEQPVYDTKKRKRGRLKKLEGDKEDLGEEAAADIIESAPTPEEPSGPDMVKRGRGRPKKSQSDPDNEPEAAASVEQSGPSLPQEHVEHDEQDHKRKRGKPKKSKKVKNELEETEKMQLTPSSGELSGELRVDEKRKSSRLKRPKTGNQETQLEKKHGAANGGREARDRRRSSRGKSSGEQSPASKTTPTKGLKKENRKSSLSVSKKGKMSYLPKIEVDGIEFQVGDDVYVKKSDGDGPESDCEVEDCRICGTTNEETMLECDGCLAGFHLTCLSPPLESVPEGDWICSYCEKGETPPEPATSERRHRSARERLLACDLWAARIERMWRETDGTPWFTAHWFLVPEETALGRQQHNGKRELFRSNRTDDNEMDSILRHCYVMRPEDYKNSTGEGDDVFFCEYEYNEQWSKFKRIEYLDENEHWSEDDQAYDPSDESEEEGNAEDSGGRKRRASSQGKRLQPSKSIKAANKRHNYSRGIEEVGAKTIPDGIRKRPQTEFDRAKAALALSAIPPSLPCRDRERKEISTFLRDSVGAGEHCLGRCLYISGVPGTGKTATVLEVIKELGSKVELGELPPYRFVEINGLRLPSPEHAYTILHEALTGQHVGWKRALQYLDERFSKSEPGKGVDARPTVLLVDELDLLVTRNQSVLYNVFDWPTRPLSRLVIIGIANTMDLPERMLPRIASRMGMHRISFSPYSHKQLEEIISARLEGVQVFDKQAAEFASRKVAAVSGDIRRALELCRRAVEVAEARLKLRSLSMPSPGSNDPSSNGATAMTQEAHRGLQGNGGSIILADVDAAISEMFEAPQIQMMKRSAKLAKIFLVAMVYEQRRTSMAETAFEKIAATCSELCTSNGEERPDWDTLLAIGCKLGASRLLLCEPGAQHRLQKLQLNFPCDDVSFALKKDEESPWLAKYL
ncbi:unnamed protein product [Calypogeia fissa]